MPKKIKNLIIIVVVVGLMIWIMKIGRFTAKTYTDIRMPTVSVFVHTTKTTTRRGLIANVTYGSPFRITITIKAKDNSQVKIVEQILLKSATTTREIDLLKSPNLLSEDRVHSGRLDKFFRISNLFLEESNYYLNITYQECEEDVCSLKTENMILKFSDRSRITSNWLEDVLGI